ncbi:MAG: Bax inhibitor-1/YccA family protein [Pseudomonadota bacterium]
MNFTKYNTSVQTSAKYDVGLRAYMLQVFNYMAIALVITGVAAYYASSDAFMSLMISQSSNSLSPFGWAIQLSPLFIVMFLSYKINSMSLQAAQITFWVYSVLMGLSLGILLLQYTGESIAKTFLITASVFGTMSLYGYSTKKDLTSLGSFMMMGVIGLVIASLINLFLQSSAIAFATSIIGVIIFTGLTAYDVQKIKNVYIYSPYSQDSETASKSAIYGALTLYIDFINLFIMLLRFFGSRRD